MTNMQICHAKIDAAKQNIAPFFRSSSTCRCRTLADNAADGRRGLTQYIIVAAPRMDTTRSVWPACGLSSERAVNRIIREEVAEFV